MDDISEFLLGPQHPAASGFGVVLAVVALLLAAAMMGYLVWCYIRERRIRKRMRRRALRPHGGNIVSPIQELSETKRLKRKSSRTLPWPGDEHLAVKGRRRGAHPWKRDRSRFNASTPL